MDPMQTKGPSSLLRRARRESELLKLPKAKHRVLRRRETRDRGIHTTKASSWFAFSVSLRHPPILNPIA
jgi:hypothetical protein